MRIENNGSVYTAYLTGRIDSENAAAVEQEILDGLQGRAVSRLVLDAAALEYSSSAGLRVILRLKKTYPDLTITNVSSDVYEILEMTGFTEMMQVEKAYRVVSVEGCEVIGEGFNGKVYRIDKDNVVKTYKNADALSEIQHEREVARLALILGVPTAISYDVVRVGDSYGSVFELLDSRSFAKLLANEPDMYEFCVTEYVKMLKKIHSITVPAGKLPSIKEKTLKRIERMKDLLPDGLGDKLLAMAKEIPECDRMIHGDYHTKNIVLAGDEVLLIDMDTLSVGHPIFELVGMYNAYVGYSEYDPSIVLSFQRYPAQIARRFWHDSLAAYLNARSDEKVREVEEKVRCLSYAYLIDWATRHNAGDPPTVALWTQRLIELLGRVDSLQFEVEPEAPESDELTVEAVTSNLQTVTDFVNERLEKMGFSPKVCMQIDLAVDEIFSNVAMYAYAPGTGDVTVEFRAEPEPPAAVITFSDRGTPFDPLTAKEPDVSLSADDRPIGGLGVFLVKKMMDEVRYAYQDGQNVLTMKKKL